MKMTPDLLTWLREMKEVSLNWFLLPEPIREPNLVEDKPIQGQGNHITRQRGTGKRSASSEGKGGQSPRTWVKLREGEQIVDLFN